MRMYGHLLVEEPGTWGFSTQAPGLAHPLPRHEFRGSTGAVPDGHGSIAASSCTVCNPRHSEAAPDQGHCASHTSEIASDSGTDGEVIEDYARRIFGEAAREHEDSLAASEGEAFRL